MAICGAKTEQCGVTARLTGRNPDYLPPGLHRAVLDGKPRDQAAAPAFLRPASRPLPVLV